MIKLFSLIILGFISVRSFAQSALNIVPLPLKIENRPGYFLFNKNVSVQYLPEQVELRKLDTYLRIQLKNRFGLKISKGNKNSAFISFLIDPKLTRLGNEGYILRIDPDNIQITATDSKGIFYGIQSLLQCIPFGNDNNSFSIACSYIEDKPRFNWRGMMLDVSRHFFSVEEIKNFLDIMATYKMNVFHWHLVDDQGWRLQIKKYPKLTSVGAWRM